MANTATLLVAADVLMESRLRLSIRGQNIKDVPKAGRLPFGQERRKASFSGEDK
jgi:hypothetical protein